MTVGELTVQSKRMNSSSVIQDLSQVDHSKRLFQPGGGVGITAANWTQFLQLVANRRVTAADCS